MVRYNARKLVLLLLALVASAAMAQKQDQTPPLKPGSAWVNQIQDSGSYGTRSFEAESRVRETSWDGARALLIETPNGGILQQATGEWIGLVDKDQTLVISYDPPLSFAWPLEVGKSTMREFKVKMRGQDSPVALQLRETVEAYEEVTVPAGTFNAYRVRSEDSMGNISIDWFVPELGIYAKRSLERTSSHAMGPGRREMQLKSHDIQ